MIVFSNIMFENVCDCLLMVTLFMNLSCSGRVYYLSGAAASPIQEGHILIVYVIGITVSRISW